MQSQTTAPRPEQPAATPRSVPVRELDLSDDDLLRQWYDITKSAETFERPWATFWSLEELSVQARTPDETLRWILTGAFEDEQMVGTGLLQLPLLDNTDKVYGGIWVDPARRRRGIGSALVENSVELMRTEGRTLLLVESGIPGEEREDHPYARFAFDHGFTMANVEVHRVLDLPLDTAQIRAMQAEAAPHHEGYEIRTFEDEIPEELLPSYVHLLNQLALDAPTGDIDFEEEAFTPEHFREKLARTLEQGRHRLSTVAIAPSGEAVAHSDLVVPREDRPKVYQWGTLVRRDHRGHHLGAAVKLQNLLALQERFPERTEIHTTNAETNEAMIGINERLGFRAVEICPEFMLEI
ncbi:MAG TPA: GNAT family N-acetyltransferase [Nocardioidaceae bacterium]|nr:GNAT family N-acetyltransferase [Nocardioidaceae bacterium]